MKGYNKLRHKALKILSSELSEELYYHGFHHTKDVLRVCNQYIRRENLESHEAKLLRLGALLHDIGFIVSNLNHEEKGVEITEKLMGELKMTDRDYRVVKGLIIATKIPQTPKNKLEEIICDADLDYLGRPDFYQISNALFKELKVYSDIQDMDTWNRAQIKFLEAHQYHTPFAIKNRQPEKEKRISEIKKKLKK